VIRAIVAIGLSVAISSHHGAFADPPAPPLSPAARSAVNAWREAVAEARAKEAETPPSTPLQEIASRGRIDAAARIACMPVLLVPTDDEGPLSEQDRIAARNVISPEIAAIDASNTAYLKAHLPEAGWFSPKEHGAIVTAMAWVIVQHSPDQDLQKEALTRIEPLLALGQFKPSRYAMLYDRVAIAYGRPQRYGTQATCKAGEIVQLHPMEDPDRVDDRRKAIGLGPAKEDADAMGVGVRRC